MAEVRETRWRPLAYGLAALVALVVAGLAAFRLVDEPAPPEIEADPAAEATEVARRWTAAWAAGDAPGMVRQSSGGTASLAVSVAAFGADLGTTRLVVEPGVVELAADRASAVVPLRVSVTLARGQVWSYDSRLGLVRGTSRWSVPWSPAALHPELSAGRRIVVEAVWAPRAPVLDAAGVPIAVTPSLRSVVGAAGPASAERSVQLGGRYRVGQQVGLSGVQATFEHQLAGDPTLRVRVVEAERQVGVLAELAGRAPSPVRTTIDPRVQGAAEAALAAPVPDPAKASRPAALVAIEASTGSVRAVVSRPGNGFSRALQGRYPPGSVFKIVTTAALLQHGVTPGTGTTCPKEVLIGGRKFVNAEGEELGAIPFTTAFAHSCNTAFVQLASKLEARQLVEAADMFGFNRDAGLGTAAAASSVPLPGSAADQAATAIGQGRILVTPLQMANVAATVANNAYRPPRLVDDGPPVGLRLLPDGVGSAIGSLMRLVVSEGTGKAAAVRGAPVGGKTGTAEFGSAAPPRVHAWFVGFRGDLAFAVVVEDADGFGGTVAAPMVADFLRRLG